MSGEWHARVSIDEPLGSSFLETTAEMPVTAVSRDLQLPLPAPLDSDSFATLPRLASPPLVRDADGDGFADRAAQLPSRLTPVWVALAAAALFALGAALAFFLA